LEPGKQPRFRPLYSLNKKELQAVQEFLVKSLQKGYIRLLESPAGYLILIVLKKDGKFRLYIDYRQLNNNNNNMSINVLS